MRVAIWNDEAKELGEIGVDNDGNPIVEMAGAWEEVKTRSDIKRVLDWVLDTPEGLLCLVSEVGFYYATPGHRA